MPQISQTMKKIFLKSILCIAVLFFCVGRMSAAPVSVTAKLDSVQLLMGNITMLNLELVVDQNTLGNFPLFNEIGKEGVVGVNGDSIELRGFASVDTIELGSNRLQINYKVPLQSFDSGVYVLPKFEYVAQKDTIYSNNVVLKVVPVKVGEDEAISGFMTVEEPLNPSIFDSLPDWLYEYWWALLIVALLIAAIIILIIRYKKTGKISLVKTKELLPHEVALNKLDKLKEKKLWEQGLERVYFTELTEILRVYLQTRFGINAMEMTSSQIIRTLSVNSEISDKKSYIERILDVADFVKFAKMRPLPNENTEAFDNAVCFINETKPIEKDIDEENSDIGKEVKQ